MSGKNHEENKSPDIYDGNEQRRFLCTRAMKHEAMKAYEAQESSLERNKVGRTPKCPRPDKAVTGGNNQKWKGHECPLADRSVAGSNVQKKRGH
jgi:hypothetical protein